jgi:hypothetical protein
MPESKDKPDDKDDQRRENHEQWTIVIEGHQVPTYFCPFRWNVSRQEVYCQGKTDEDADYRAPNDESSSHADAPQNYGYHVRRYFNAPAASCQANALTEANEPVQLSSCRDWHASLIDGSAIKSLSMCMRIIRMRISNRRQTALSAQQNASRQNHDGRRVTPLSEHTHPNQDCEASNL